MSRTSLQEFAKSRGQTEAASILGMTQGSLSKAIRVGRAVYVTAHDDGTFTAEEVRSFPSQPTKTVSPHHRAGSRTSD